MKQQNAMDFIYWEGTEGQREKKRGKRKKKEKKKELEREMSNCIAQILQFPIEAKQYNMAKIWRILFIGEDGKEMEKE